MSEILRDS
jgi:hypothetical protein